MGLYFLGLNMTLSVLPLFVEQDLGGTSTQVGLSVSSFGLAAACIRPIVGPLGDRHGRRILILGGCLVAGSATLLTATASTIFAVVIFRAIAGLGEAAVFVGAASAIQDITPDDRRGESASYYSLAIYSSLFIGPPLGEWIFKTHGTTAAWLVAGGFALAAGTSSIFAPGAPAEPPPKPVKRVLLHRAALRPGLVLFLGLFGFTGFLAFAALHAQDIGIANTGTVFTVFAAVVITLRIFAAKLPDQLGPVMTSRISLTCSALGLFLLFAWQSTVGVYVAAAVMAVAQSFLFPALFALVVDTAPDTERSHAISTLSMFFDLAFGLGGPIIGVVADLADRPTGFLLASVIATIGLLSCRRVLGEVNPSTTQADIGPRSRR